MAASGGTEATQLRDLLQQCRYLIDDMARRADVEAASHAAVIARLVSDIKALPRYQEHDVVRRSSMTEYFDAEQVEELLAALSPQASKGKE